MSRGFRPRRRFGQHFLGDAGIVTEIIAAIQPTSSDTLVEIGPGRGALTGPLLATGAYLHAVELDRDLAAELGVAYGDQARFELHQMDALRLDFAALGADLRVIGNLPYNISTPLMFHLLDSLSAIRDMHFMLQKEVVARMAAAPGGKDFGRLTVMLGCRLHVEALFDVPPECFRPPPKVMSSVVRLIPRRGGEAFDIDDAELLSGLVGDAFAQRRKTVRNALRNRASPAELESAGIDPGARAERIPVADWVRLANALSGRR